jgi:hypothetical protein
MNATSTMLTVGTALRHAQDSGVRVHALVDGMWMSGTVAGLDGEGVVLLTPEGDTTVVRIRAVTAVRVERGLERSHQPTGPTDARPAPDAGAPRGRPTTGADKARDLAIVPRQLHEI